MSNLLSQASLVMIPSGYKEDIVYSPVPTNGNGDLSFTRASNGTRINSAGLVEVCPWNLFGYSEQFNNASGWLVQNGASITPNSTTAPNGTTTADTISYGTSSISACYQRVTNGAGVFTLSVYAKCSSGTQSFKFIMYNSADGQVDGPIYTVTTEWQRFQHSFTVTQPANWYIANANDSVSRSIFIWGAQLNIGSTAKPYFPTTDRLNVPRLTYQNGGGGCPSLLLEKQSTNLVTYSEQFDNASWSLGNSSITANATTSPDGTQNAEKLYTNTATSTHQIRKTISSVTAQNYTMSIFAKKGELNYIRFWEDGQTGKQAYFNLNTGVATNVDMTSASIENMGNGWFRCSAVVAIPASGVFGYRVLLTPDGTTTSFTGNGSDGVFLYGAQLEASSYATSYIPTTSSSATRVADGSPDTATLLSNKLSYSVFLDFYPRPLGNFQYFFIQKNSSANAEIIWGGTSGGTDFAIYDYTAGSICNVAINDGNRHKIVLSQASGKIDVFVDGSQVATQKTTSATGFYYVAFDGNPGIYKINELAIMSKITNADAIALTTL